MKELTIVLESKGKTPLYEQIYEYLKREMLEGNITPGERLPSTRSLAVHLQVSRSTIDLAYEQLLAEGYLESIPCKGYYACDIRALFQLKTDKVEKKQVQTPAKPSYAYDFALNGIDPDGFPMTTWSKISRRILLDDTGKLFQQGEARGEVGLRQAICDYLYSARGVHCSAEQILVGAGNDYLLMILSVLLGRETAIGMENPTYTSAYDTFRNLGHPLYPISMDGDGMQVDALRQTEANVAYVMPSHQFPTGVVMPIGRRNELLSWADEVPGRYIIEDDYDSEFRYKGKPIPALRGMDKADRVIYLGTFSKSIAPAIRISYMVLPEELLERQKQRGHFYSQTVSCVDQKIIEVLLRDGYYERHLNRMRALYKSKQELLTAELKKLKQYGTVSGENAGVHIVFTLKQGCAEKDIIQKAKDCSIRIYGMSDYEIAPSGQSTVGKLLLGYAT
ncbi:MAG: PLP-dependent aminotransferase family protein, partial [Lachnospiraceae bacterium]|nr:PLP-dependent aminotransferase family protein [Lachnospiraceae bacterium]